MKALLYLVLMLCAGALFGQTSESSKCGLDDKATLNDFEAKYFNEVFQKRRKEFDFTGKNVGYFSGTSGNSKSTKSYYFRYLKNGNNGDMDVHRWNAGGTQLLVLTEQEKQISGGYDVILVSWSKLLKTGKTRAKLVKKLRGKLPNNGYNSLL